MEISREFARRFLLGHHRLDRFGYEREADGMRRMLRDLRCVQLDPLAPMLSSPELVALARCEDYRMGDLFEGTLPGGGFEHFAKERCLLPSEAFPYYRRHAVETPWWRLGERMKRVSSEVLDAVLAEVRECGPATPSQLADHGSVTPLDWSGWKGTGKHTTMALEILWTRCEVVVCGRSGREKIYDIPERALPDVAEMKVGAFERWALLNRVDAAGLLPRNSGPHWSMINHVRKSELPDQLIEEGQLIEVRVEGATTKFLARPDILERSFEEPDQHMRILGPLDPFLWFRPLIQHVFDFEYIWEVYKPEKQRRWGWYVCPLLHEGQLVGRLEGRVRDDRLEIDRVWRQAEHTPDRDALKAALARHARALGLKRTKLPSRFRAPA